MDSSLKNPSYHHQWQPPSAPFPPPPPPISHQFHPERFNRSNQSDLHHQNYHNFTHRQGFPPKPPIKQPPSSYPQPPPPPHVSYESPWISQPYQSAWVGYMEKRLDSRLVDPNYQLDYGNRTRDCSNGVFASDLDSNSRFRDGFSSLGYERKDFGDVRIDESNRDCGQFQPESDGYCRSLRVGTSFAYGNVPYGGATLHRDIVRNSASIGLTGNQRWVETQKDDYYRSEIEPYFDNGKTKGGDEMNRTTNRSQHPAHFSEKRFNSFRVKRKETSCTAGNVLLREVTKKKESFPPPTSSDIENLSRCSEVGVPFAGKSMSSFQSQPCEDEIPKKDMDDLSSRNLQTEEVNDNNSFIVETNTTTRVDSLDGTVVSQAESKNFSQSQACENGVNSSVETVSRKESMETTPLNSTAEVDHNLGSDAGKYTCIISISSSPKNVAEKGSSNVQLVERTSVLLSSICKNKEGWSNGLVFDRELSSAVHLEDSSYAPNQDLGLSSHDPVEIPSVDQSCNLVCRGLKACSSESDVSLSKDTNVGASEFHFNQEVKEKAPTCNNSPVLEIENNAAIGNMGSSGSKTVTDSECALLETQPCLAGCKVFPNDHLGCGASDVVCSFWVSSVEKDRVDVPLRISSCLVPDSSVSVNEQTQNSASSLEANCSSLCGIIERDRAENMDVDIQEEKVKPTGETSQCGTSGTDFVTVSGDSMFLCRSSSTIPGLIIGQIQNETHAAANIDKTKNSKKCNKEEILVDASQGQIITFHETVQGHYPCSGQTSLGTDAESCELPMDKCGDGILVKKTDGKPTEKLTDVPSDLGSEEISLNIVNTDVYVGEARTESLGNSDVLLSKLHSHADDKCAVAQVKDYVVALTPPDSQSMTTLSSKGEKTQKRANKFLHAAQESYPRSLYDTKKDANPPINVTKHHTWHRKSDASASPLVAVKPKVTVQSSSTYVRKGNSLFRKPSPGSLGEAQSLQRHSWPLSDSTSSGKCALSSGMVPLSNGLPGSSSGEADLPDFVQNELKSSDTLTQTGYASDCQPKQYPPKLESLNPSKMLYVKRKANQLVAASDIHGASKSEIPHSGGYFKRSKNQLVRSSESLANQAKSLPVDALDSQTGEKMVSKRSSSSALSEFAIMRPFNQSNFSLVWTLKEPLSRKANRVHISPQKIVPQPVPWKRATYWRRLMNPASVLRNYSFSTMGRKFLMMRKRRTVYRRSTNEYSLKRSKVISIGGSHLKWSKSVERDSKKPEYLSYVESSRSGPPECWKDTKKSFIPKRLVIGNDESVWIRNGNRLVGNPKKRTRVLANEKVRWSLHNVRLRLAKKRNYCQFFTRFGKCNKDDGKCPYIHDPSKIAVCTKFVSRSCADPDYKLTHKVVPERMPDCSYFLQGVCNNEPCLYRHIHVHQNAAICEGFLRGYCSDGNENCIHNDGQCRKKHTYTCPVFEATGYCPQESQCKLHHPKNRSKGKKRKRASEPWQKNSCGRYFGSMHKDLPEHEPILVNELATDGAVFGGEGLDFIRLDVNEHEASENMDSSTTESVSDDSEAHDSIEELIRPVGLMQKSRYQSR